MITLLKGYEMKNYVLAKKINDFLATVPSSHSMTPFDAGCDGDSIVMMMGCTTDKFREFLKNCFHFYVDETDMTIHFDCKYFEAIDAICDCIHQDYDDFSNLNDIDMLPLSTWKLFDLSGDDDVDYNGSYIQTAVDWLRTYIENV